MGGSSNGKRQKSGNTENIYFARKQKKSTQARANSDIPPLKSKNAVKKSISSEKEQAFNFDNTDEFVPQGDIQDKNGWRPSKQDQFRLEMGQNCLSDDSSFGAIPEELIDYTAEGDNTLDNLQSKLSEDGTPPSSFRITGPMLTVQPKKLKPVASQKQI